MTAADESGGRRETATGIVARSRFFRGATLSLIFGGLGQSIAMPLQSLLLVQELGASLPVAGWFFLTNAAAPLLGFLVGNWSERMVDRLWLFRLGAIVGGLGWLGMAASTHVWMAYALNLTVLGFSGATASLIFAAVRDRLTEQPTRANNRVMSTVRLGFSFGFMAGPVLGSVLASAFSLRIAFVVAAVVTVLQIVPLIGENVRRSTTPVAVDVEPSEGHGDTSRPVTRTRSTSLAPLLGFLGLCVLAMSGETVKFAYLPIYMEEQLGTAPWLRGVVISVQSLGMLIFIPIMGIVADRVGGRRLLPFVVLLGVVANLGFMLGPNELMLIAATMCNAAMWAALSGVGITVAQDLYPVGVGLASTLYFSAIRLAGAVGGLVGGLGVGWFGIPGVFAIPAAFCLAASVGMLTQAALASRRASGSVVPDEGPNRGTPA